jgi:hypothetical protein
MGGVGEKAHFPYNGRELLLKRMSTELPGDDI